jgi:hypothetical protein
MRNVTITLDEKVLRWAKIQAARLDTSVSRLVGDMLGERMEAQKTYGRAMRRFMGRKPVRLKESSGSYPSREELHDRPHVR